MMSERTFRVGTRGSLLARTQTGSVIAYLKGLGLNVEEVIIRTEGDDTTTSLIRPGRPGVFVSALRSALVDDRVDVIVHSHKDLPSLPEPGIALAAIPQREDARDVIVSKENLILEDLPVGARVGTSSPRREARIRWLRPDLQMAPIRGNVDTRIEKVRQGEFDATVLASAGLHRLGLSEEISQYLTLTHLVPAPAQGALAIEVRSSDLESQAHLSGLDDALSRLRTIAERAVLVGVGATCATAIGAYAEVVNSTLTLVAELSDLELNSHERVEFVAEMELGDHESARRLGMDAARALVDTETGARLAGLDA